jgi:hypothetical protein
MGSAIKCLGRGDHYLLVMWDMQPLGERPPGDLLKLISTALAIILLVTVGAFLSAKFEPQWRWLKRHIPIPTPRVMWSAFVGLIVLGLFFQRQVASASDWFFKQFVIPFLKRKHTKNDES